MGQEGSGWVWMDPLTRPWKGIRVAYDKRTPEGLVPVETLVKTAFEESGFRCNSEAAVDSSPSILLPRGACVM